MAIVIIKRIVLNILVGYVSMKYEGQLYMNSGVRSYKREQLCLYGPTNVGKSSCVENLIGRGNTKFVFYQGVGKFFIQGFGPFIHEIIVF